jgi:HK97 family phage prohead protease
MPPTATLDAPREAATRESPREARSVFPLQGLKLEEPMPDGRRRIEGYAAVFGNRDSYGDIIMPGAFEESLATREVKVLWQHNTMHPIGLQEAAVEDEFGLAVVGALTNTELVTGTVVPLLLDGVISGLSIGYNVLEEDYDGELQAWLLKKIELWEWSPVTFPANELATVSTVKELGTRKAANVSRADRHVKHLLHLFGEDGYFSKSDRQEALDSGQLEQLHSLLGGLLPGAASEANSKLIEAAYQRGASDILADLGFEPIDSQGGN